MRMICGGGGVVSHGCCEEEGEVSTKVKPISGQETQAERPCGVGGLWSGAVIVTE
jgi:hypothetical protein